jgi:peptidylprolyl isomerase
MAQAKSGDNVTIHYTGKLTDGTIFHSTDGHDPLTCTLSCGEFIVGLEEAIIGMSQEESKTVTIPQSKAYGPRNEQKVINVPRSELPSDIEPKVGVLIQLQVPLNEPITAHIIGVTDEYVTLDSNPPLAGQDLIFDIKLVSINP